VTDEEARVALATQAQALADTVGVLATAVDNLNQRTGKTERTTIFVVVGLVIDLVLSVAVAVLVSSQVSASTDLQSAVARETSTRQDALCPLYGLLLGSSNPTSRAEGSARDQYDEAFRVMRRAYDTLDCANPVVPPRVDQPPATIPPR
jgi:hypothetical protein